MSGWPRLAGDGILSGADDTAAHAADRPGAAAVCKHRGELDERGLQRKKCLCTGGGLTSQPPTQTRVYFRIITHFIKEGFSI